MDISILLALQKFRDSFGLMLNDFMLKMTFYGERSTAIVIMAILYWAVSKELGTYLLMGFSGNRLLNGFLKNTFCVYRPWIRDARIIPYGNSMVTATGYSFPSGHTMNAATVFGGGVFRKDFSRALRILCFICVLLVGFSRLYLGVHTPQDVLVGTLCGLLVMFLTLKLMDYLEKNPEKDTLVLCIGLVLSVAISVYSILKTYPEDFDANGKLIVNGVQMSKDALKGVSYSMGMLTGWFLERRFIQFSTEVSVCKKIGRVVFGILGFYVVSLVISPRITKILTGYSGTIISCFLQFFYVTYIFPLFMKIFEKNS